MLVCRGEGRRGQHARTITRRKHQGAALTSGAASSGASGPPSSATSRVDDGAAALRRPVLACGEGELGGPSAGAGRAARSNWRGGGQAEEGEGQRTRRGLRGAMAAADGRSGQCGE